MQEEEALKGVTVLHGPLNIVNQMVAVPTTILEKPVCPVVTCSRNIIDEGFLVEDLANITL
jgi:hypothetical protein